MSLFDQLVDEPLKSRADLTTLRPVVEKELLHHDILRELADAGLLAGLTFIGGTCLRACYGSAWLSKQFGIGWRGFFHVLLESVRRVGNTDKVFHKILEIILKLRCRRLIRS